MSFMKFKQAGPGRLVCEVLMDKRFDSLISDKIELHADVTYHQEAFFNCQLEVLAVPGRMSLYQLTRSRNLNGATHTSLSIKPVVQVGDMVVIHYLNLDSTNIFFVEGKFIAFVNYADVIARISPDGEVQAVGGHILIKEDPEMVLITDEEKLWTPEVELNKRYVLSYIDVPLEGDPIIDISPGKKLVLTATPDGKGNSRDKHYGEYKVGSEKYIVTHQSKICAIFA